MDDLSQRKDVRRREKSAKLAAANTRVTVTNIMSSAAGRQWIHALLESCHCFHTSITPSPYLTYAREGERNIGLRILTDVMSSCPEEYITMMREAVERENLDGQRTDDRQPADDSRSAPRYEPVIDASGHVVDYIADDDAAGDYNPVP